MSDEQKSFLHQAGEGNSGSVSETEAAPRQEQQGEGSQKPITRAEVLQLIKSETKKLAQSYSDTVAMKVRREIERLNSAGIEATQEQVIKLVQDEVETQEEESQPSRANLSTSAPASPGEPRGDFGGHSRQAIDACESLMRFAGIDPDTIDEKDPDFGLINFGGTDDDLYESVREFVAQKKARKGNQARIPQMGTGVSGRNATKQALIQEYDQLARSPSANHRRMKEIADELGKLK